MTVRLDVALVESPFRVLPHGSGDTSGVFRTVVATSPRADELNGRSPRARRQWATTPREALAAKQAAGV